MGSLRGARDIDLVLDQRLVFQDFAGEHESVARDQRLDEIFLDLAQQPPAARDHLRGARADQADLEHVGLDDGADIHAVALRDHGVADAPAAVLALPDLGEALVGLERIAPGRDEIEHRVEIGAREAGIGRGAPDLRVELIGEEGLAASRAEHVLRQHVECADARRRRVLRVLGDGAERGGAFQHLETVRRNKHAFRRLVHAVIGATDALQKARSAFRRTDIDHQVDVAPVDAEIERGRGNHGLQAALGHCGFDLAALGDVERAVMQRNCEAVVVDAPQLLKDALGLAAGVDEDERRLVALDQLVDLAERMMRGMSRPRQALGRIEHADVGGAAFGDHEIGQGRAVLALRHEKAAQIIGLRDRRRQSDAGEIRRKREQPRQPERQQIAAFGRDQGMQLVEHDALERAEQIGRIGRRQDQRQLLGRA